MDNTSVGHDVGCHMLHMDEADGNFCIVLCIVTIATGGRVKTSSHQLFNGTYGAQGRERNRDFSASDQLASHHLFGLLGSVPVIISSSSLSSHILFWMLSFSGDHFISSLLWVPHQLI
ncbi:hypothetical protein M514_14164 [Trichuris suis]|uniref:Uncharacterized protein n=1 Tax=Trichuris suis TaxID=68888 RepID=A0A085NHK9_9BILA|nr:hypothetical protein M514_14164 [Trichuris suis]